MNMTERPPAVQAFDPSRRQERGGEARGKVGEQENRRALVDQSFEAQVY